MKFAKNQVKSSMYKKISRKKSIKRMNCYNNHKNQKITTIIICGKEVWGHKAGHSLFELHKNGVDKNNVSKY